MVLRVVGVVGWWGGASIMYNVFAPDTHSHVTTDEDVEDDEEAGNQVMRRMRMRRMNMHIINEALFTTYTFTERERDIYIESDIYIYISIKVV